MEDKRFELIVLYADIVGSTKLVKNLNQKQIRRFYPIFLNEMTYVINDFGGRILKFVGDCIIGFFILSKIGWILQVDSAVWCAQMMQKIMKYSINPIAQFEGLPFMRCRIGMDLGEVQIIKVGIEGIYTEVDVFGDVMNISKKICDNAEPEEILIGKNLWNLIYTKYKMRSKKVNPIIRYKESYDLFSLTY